MSRSCNSRGGVWGLIFQRNVTLLRLPDRRLIIHSTAPFEPEDVIAIRRFGEPARLVEATLSHDTFAKGGAGGFRAPVLLHSGEFQSGERPRDRIVRLILT
jgi:hypothetical protein